MEGNKYSEILLATFLDILMRIQRKLSHCTESTILTEAE